MTARRNAFLSGRGPLLSVLTAAFLAGCVAPANVVLYEERQKRANAKSSQFASTQGAGSVAAPGPGREAGAGGRSRGQIEKKTLPPAKPGFKPDRQALNALPRSAASVKSSDRRAAGIYRPVPKDGYHKVARSETVYAISRLYGVPVRSLLVINKLEPPFILRLGQRVRVPAQRRHVVAGGETVYAISRRYDVSIKELVRLNGVGSPFTIKTGQTLLLPDSQEEERQSPRSALAAASGAAKPPKSAAFAGKGGAARVAANIPPSAKDLAPPPRAKPVLLPPSTNIPRPSRLSGKGFIWPVSGRVISRFGAKGRGLHNDGINIAARRGTPIRAAQNGVVAYRGNELRGFGNLILVKHAKGYMTAYAHTERILVKRGQRVKRGQIIARVGSSGAVDRPQLHFEIRKSRRAVNPAKYLRKRRAALPQATPAVRYSDRNGLSVGGAG